MKDALLGSPFRGKGSAGGTGEAAEGTAVARLAFFFDDLRLLESASDQQETQDAKTKIMMMMMMMMMGIEIQQQ